MDTATWHTNSPPEDWDKTQLRLEAHFLQTTPWGKFQGALGKPTFYASGQDWSWLAIVEKSRLGHRLYCPYGPTVASSESLRQALGALAACAQHEQVSYIRIEPQGDLTAHDLTKLGLHRARRDIQPPMTWVKRLDKNEDELIGRNVCY